jgi:hypothetical protein
MLFRVSEALRLGGYLTLTGADGAVYFEDGVADDGVLSIRIVVPAGTKQVQALLEAGTMYRHAVIDLVDRGVTEYEFT